MVRVLMVCHGNICRSPMAEFVFREMVAQQGLQGEIAVESAATSTEEIGNPVHPGTKRILHAYGVPMAEHRAVQMTRADYGKYDYLLGMDGWNRKNMLRIVGQDPAGKIACLLDFTDSPRDIADPWYTGDFEATYRDVREGCAALLAHIRKEKSFV